jgi:hypothetical protein
MATQAIKLLRDHKKYINFQNSCLDWAKSLTWQKATDDSINLLHKVAKQV